jgi:hypothetical protein
VALLSGLLIGSAPSIRYSEGLLLLPLLLVAFFRLAHTHWSKQTWTQAIAMCIGWAAPVIALALHNRIAMGAWTGYDPTNEDDAYLQSVDYAPSSFLTASQLDKKMKSGYSADIYTRYDQAVKQAVSKSPVPEEAFGAPSDYLKQLYKYDMSDPEDVVNKAMGLMPKSFKYDGKDDEARQAVGQLPQKAETYIKNSMEFTALYTDYAQKMQQYVDDKYVNDQTAFPLFDSPITDPSKDAPDIVARVKQYYDEMGLADEADSLKIRDYTTATGYAKASDEIDVPLLYLPDDKLPMNAEDFTPSEDAVKRVQYMNDYAGQSWYNPINLTSRAQDYAEQMLAADRQNETIQQLKATGEYDKMQREFTETRKLAAEYLTSDYSPEGLDFLRNNLDTVYDLGAVGGAEEVRIIAKSSLYSANEDKTVLANTYSRQTGMSVGSPFAWPPMPRK